MVDTIVRNGGAARIAGLRKASFRRLYDAAPADIVALVRDGVAAVEAKGWIARSRLPVGETLRALDLPVATFNKIVARRGRFSPAVSERIVGFARLIGKVEKMVEGAGRDARFDAAEWLSRWLRRPLPALGGARPIEFMDTVTGQAIVAQKLDQIALGAYA